MHRIQKTIFVACGFLTLIRTTASFFPEQRLWGVNLLHYLPPVPRWILVGVAFLVLIPKINQKVADVLASLLSRIEFLLEGLNRHLKYALLSLLSLPLFWLFKERIYLLGDGNLRGAEIVAGMRFSSTEPLDLFFHAVLYQILKLGVYDIYALTSCLAGVGFVYLMLLLVDNVGQGRGKKIFFFSVLISMGTNQLFFGYMESYTLMYVALMAFIMFSWLHLQGERSLLFPTVTFLLAASFHLAGLMLLPSLVYLYLAKDIKDDPGNRNILKLRKLVLLGFLFSIIGAGIWILKKNAPASVSLDSLFLFPLGGSRESLYALLSFSHIADVFNHQLLVSPVGAVIWFVLIFSRGKRIDLKSRMMIFLLLTTIPQLLFALLLTPQLGYPRDWDLFAFTSTGYTIWGIYLLMRRFREVQLHRVRYVTLALFATALISTVPWIYVNATQDRAIERFEHILRLDMSRAALGHECLAYNYRRLGQKEKEVEEWRRAIRFSNKPRYIKNLGAVYVEIGQYNKAAQKLEEVLKLDPHDHLTHSDLGKVYALLEQDEKAKIHLQRAVDLQPDNPIYYENLGLFLMNLRLYDESIELFKRALEIRPDFLPFWRYTGIACANSGKESEAIKYLQQYLKYAPQAEDRTQIETMIEELKGEAKEH